jgi:alcohol dehydrogenase class IV
MTFAYRMQTDVRAGEGSAAEAVEYARRRGSRRVAVVLDAGAGANEHARRLVDGLRDTVDFVQVLESDAVEPDYDYLEEFRGLPEADLDLMVGIGGGSTLDLAKALSVLVSNPGPAISYRGFDLVERPGVPLVAVPTTAGTGSEVTPNAVFTDLAEGRKLGINTSLYLPKLAVLDPLLTLSCPRSVTVSAGLDALVHAVESFVAAGATPFSRVYSREAFRLLVPNLSRAVERPDDVEARFRLQLAAFYAGAALMNSGAGPAGALSYPLGVRFGVAHGLAGGFFLVPVAEWNAARGSDEYAGLADLLPEPGGDVVAALRRLTGQLGMPESLQELGVTAADVPELVEQTLLLEGALLQNPVPIGAPELEELLRGLL